VSAVVESDLLEVMAGKAVAFHDRPVASSPAAVGVPKSSSLSAKGDVELVRSPGPGCFVLFGRRRKRAAEPNRQHRPPSEPPEDS
jgi:hypothetical protein